MKKTFFGNTDVQQIQEDRILQIMPIYYKKDVGLHSSPTVS